MEKTALRIGNLVHHIGLGTSAILEIRNTGITVANPKDYSNAYYEPNDMLHRIEPITLTPEWLERFGFVWSDKYYRWRKRGERGQMFGLFRPDSGDGVWTFPKFTSRLKYVHQVQNLYFALTGQELKTTE